ncbi:ABC transporter permease [Roseimaritima ulvae]|uniref:Aliphatic sulfonates transport permease protein SsuC n=1 Tax=Roseimaritima ulvae TaxID=980254 RepID=A0A5B9QPL0_9BACT|nr:ABC transporter permease subunit [Roseimaritima ulvae]QEG39859.1 Putative aliphatic sulfonates transport permease protein SsuC [Roseimaritima ulvae]
MNRSPSRPRSSRARSRWNAVLPVALVAGVLIAVWELIIRVGDVHRVLLPHPWEVFQDAWTHRSELLLGCLITGWAAIVGLLVSVVVGTIIGILFSHFRSLRIGFFPYVMFLQTVPIIGIAPLLVTWSGYQFRTVVYVVVIISLFPIINSVTTGLLSTEPQLRDLFGVYQTGRIKTLYKLRFPAAVPFILVGVRTAGGLAVIGAIVGDFFIGFGGQHDGLGTLMLSWLNQQKTATLMAAMFASAAVGLVLYGLINLLAVTGLKKWNRKFDS